MVYVFTDKWILAKKKKKKKTNNTQKELGRWGTTLIEAGEQGRG
jgi:hypothetical protein